MDYVHLSRISLKHLTALHIMLNSHSVTLTAEQLCVSPSSVSKTLSQLRSLLNDELFYRDGTQLIPTPFALKIGPTVHSILASMNGLLHQEQFNPATYNGSFCLSMRESAFEIFAPTLAQIAAKDAPLARFNIHSKEHLGFDALLSGQVDFIILPHDISQPPTNDKDLVWERILDDEMVCIMHPSHPLSDQTLTIESYLANKHIGILDKELSIPYFEQNLTQQHHSREIAISVADFGSAAVLCHHTDFLFTSSKCWAEKALQARGLVQKSLPFDYGKVAYSLVWNKPNMNDQAMTWLRTQLRQFAV
ncbi:MULTISPECIES: LysR family transcriptional regulator [Vibrio]|uniref:LysR family transcriptional regulator n=1 Tax=Vibrio cortegadensis TaxID=1328770 RepID=A0ABV4M4B4_9VIBR|nr:MULTISPECIES: LysR family transcriptional regulator [Vibrio]MDN3695934.1 LysR family transcriptional regulator [Vibrio cortegadensis]TKF21031.1 LysR family transcriptional regulator [Vibrio genomosp. F6]